MGATPQHAVSRVWLEVHASGGYLVRGTGQDCLTVSPVSWDVAVDIAREFALRTGAVLDVDPVVRLVATRMSAAEDD